MFYFKWLNISSCCASACDALANTGDEYKQRLIQIVSKKKKDLHIKDSSKKYKILFIYNKFY